MEISNNNKKFFLIAQGSFNPKIRFLGQKVCPAARERTNRQTRNSLLWGPFQGLRIFFLQSITKDRPNNIWDHFINASHAERQWRRARGGINKSELMSTRYILSYLKICHFRVIPWGDRWNLTRDVMCWWDGVIKECHCQLLSLLFARRVNRISSHELTYSLPSP